MSVFRTTKFKALKKKYYDRLKKSGFRDIENEAGHLIDHKTELDLQAKIGFRAGLMEEIRDYYYWATDMANHARFKSTADKKIWKLHAQGMSSREIAENVPLDQSMICRKIKIIRRHLQLKQRYDKEAA